MLCWQLVRCLPIKALLQLLSSPSPRSQFSEFRRRRLCGESSIYFARFLFLFCFVLFCFYYFHALCSLIAFFYLQACRRRNHSRQLFFRRTALNDTAVEAHFDCTSENDTYDNLFVHLRAPIMSAIQNQLELDGYVCMYVLLLAYVLNIIGSHIETEIVVSLWCLEALLFIHLRNISNWMQQL